MLGEEDFTERVLELEIDGIDEEGAKKANEQMLAVQEAYATLGGGMGTASGSWYAAVGFRLGGCGPGGACDPDSAQRVPLCREWAQNSYLNPCFESVRPMPQIFAKYRRLCGFHPTASFCVSDYVNDCAQTCTTCRGCSRCGR